MCLRTLTLLLLVLVPLACGQNKNPDEVTLGVAIPSHVHAVAWIAQEKGLADTTLKLRVDVMGGSAATARSILAGSTDFGLMGGDTVIKANAAGGDLVIVAGLVNRFYHRLVGRSGTSQLSDLRGGKIGLPFLGGPQDLAARYALRKGGLDYEQDVEVLNLGREMNRIAALTRGDIDATMSQTPASELAKHGLVVLSDLPAEAAAFPYMVLVTRRSTLRTKSSQLRTVLRALCRATQFYQRDPQASRLIIDKHLKGSDTQRSNEHSEGKLLSFPPEPVLAGLQMVIEFLGPEKVKGQNPASLIDLSVLRALQASGECGGSPSR